MTSWHAPDDLLTAYVDGHAGPLPAASVEQHLLGCGHCRSRLASRVDPGPLAEVWGRVADAVESPRPTVLARLGRRLGLSEVDATVLAAAPSLRTAWFAGVLVVLAFVALAAVGGDAPGQLLFLLVAPLVPVAGVVMAYGPTGDPVHEVTSVAPHSTARIALVRACAVVATSVPPAVALGLMLPGPGWLAAAWLVPAAAALTVVLAASTWVDPLAAGTAVVLGWAVLVGAAAVRTVPLAVVAVPAQSVYAVVAVAAFAVLILRLRNPDSLGGTTWSPAP